MQHLSLHLSCLLALLSACKPPPQIAAAPEARTVLRIAAVNDFHGSLYERTVKDAHGQAVGGLPWLVSAVDALREEDPDLIVLDVMLPGKDGLEVLRALRASSTVPVVMLTARGDDVDRIVGLELGADDYVTKPFNPRELLARIKGVLRRVHSLPKPYTEETSNILSFANWKLDIERQMLIEATGKNEYSLSTVEFRLLKTFLNYPGIVLSRDQLLDMVSNRTGEVFDRSIDNQVSRLRKKIEINPKTPEIIKTVWGGGYMLATKVAKS